MAHARVSLNKHYAEQILGVSEQKIIHITSNISSYRSLWSQEAALDIHIIKMNKSSGEEKPKQVEPTKEVLEDDDFEEFPAEDWQTKEESFPVWEDNWDDDDIEEDFAQQLLQQKRWCSMMNQ